MFLTNDPDSSSPFNFYGEVPALKKNSTHASRISNFSPLVLVVEDDEDMSLMLKYLLEIWKYRVILAADTEQAIHLAEACQPDIVLVDYRFPNIDGLAFTRRVREMSSLAETVIVSISAYSESAARADALAAGSDDFLFKPIDFGKLETSLETHLQMKNKRMEGLFT